MVIKVKKEQDGVIKIFYSGAGKILTPLDIKKADRFDLELTKTIQKLEKILLRSGALSKKGKKSDVLEVWHTVGKTINQFLNSFPLNQEDLKLFWENLYGYSRLIHKSVPTTKISSTRNDFRIASLLSRYSLTMVRRVGPWASWREILSYKNIIEDNRILDWIIDELIKRPRTRDATRPLLKAVAKRFKKMDTGVLSTRELREKLKDINLTDNELIEAKQKSKN